MKLITTVIAFSLLSTTPLYAKHSSMNQSEHMKHNKMMKKDNKINRKELSAQSKQEVLAVLEANEKLHKVFFDRSSSKIEPAAQVVISAINNISDKDISNKLQFSKKKLAELKNDNSDMNDEDYHLFNMALAHIINNYNLESEYNIYSCPMSKKKWIQNSKKDKGIIYNPYDSETMPHCGSILSKTI